VDTRSPRVSKVGKTSSFKVIFGRSREREAMRSLGKARKVSSEPCAR